MLTTQLEVDPRPVAVARIGLGLVTVVNALEAGRLLGNVAAGRIAVPLLPAVPAPTTGLVAVYLVAAVLAGVALTLGWCTAPAAVATTLLNVTVLLWDQQTYSSHRLLATLLVAYLVVARSDRAWALSRRSGPVPWWPQVLMATQLSVCYLFAAASKVNGAFLSGQPLAGWVRVELPGASFVLLAVGTVVVEAFVAVGLWFRSTRRLAAVLGVSLHVSILVLVEGQTVALTGFALSCLSVYWVVLSRPDLRARGPAVLAAPA